MKKIAWFFSGATFAIIAITLLAQATVGDAIIGLKSKGFLTKAETAIYFGQFALDKAPVVPTKVTRVRLVTCENDQGVKGFCFSVWGADTDTAENALNRMHAAKDNPNEEIRIIGKVVSE